MRELLIYLLLLSALAGCASQRGAGEPGDPSAKKKTDDSPKAPAAQKPEQSEPPRPDTPLPRMDQGPGGEMIPGLLKKGDGAQKADEESSLPTGKTDLMEAARKALDKGQVEEAVAIADTLVVLHPQDPQILEFRASVLERNGDGEQAALDLARCCELGRQSCCRNQAPDRDASD